VKNNSERYAHRQYIDAKNARNLQQTIGYPITKIFLAIVDNKLIPNLPVLREEILAAEAIFGPAVAALKGKIARKKI